MGKWYEDLGQIATLGFYDPQQQREDAQRNAENASHNAQVSSKERQDSLQKGLASGEERAARYYNPSDASRRLEDSRQFNENVAKKGMDSGEYLSEKERIESSYNRSFSNLANKLGSSGVRGGAATRAKADLNRTYNKADSDLAAASAGLKRTANDDREKNARDDISKSEQMRLAEGGLNLNATAGTQLAEAAAQPTRSPMTVICTELHRQRILTDSIYKADSKYGDKLKLEKPHIYEGYYVWAKHVAALMKKSKLLTFLVALFAVPFAYQISGKWNPMGFLVKLIGEFICGIIGKIILRGKNERLQEKTA